MTYHELPEEVKEEIREIILGDDIKYNMRYLLTVYYEHIAPVTDWRRELDFAIGCGNCQKKVLRYFKRKVNEEEEATER